jgi:hypothetical protein
VRKLFQRAHIIVSPSVFDEVYAPSTLVFLREFRFGALILVVMTMTAPAALL